LPLIPRPVHVPIALEDEWPGKFVEILDGLNGLGQLLG